MKRRPVNLWTSDEQWTALQAGAAARGESLAGMLLRLGLAEIEKPATAAPAAPQVEQVAPAAPVAVSPASFLAGDSEVAEALRWLVQRRRKAPKEPPVDYTIRLPEIKKGTDAQNKFATTVREECLQRWAETLARIEAGEEQVPLALKQVDLRAHLSSMARATNPKWWLDVAKSKGFIPMVQTRYLEDLGKQILQEMTAGSFGQVEPRSLVVEDADDVLASVTS
jgi:hypothetical protein